MAHGQLGDPKAHLARNQRNEAVHPAVQPQFPGGARPIQLQAAVHVPERSPEQHPHDDEIEDTRGEHLQPAVAAMLPPAADDVELSGRQRVVHPRELVRFVLQVGIQGEDVLASRHLEAALEGRRLAEVPPERENAYFGVQPGKRPQLLERVVGRAVVDEEQLVTRLERPQSLANCRDELAEALALVVDGNDDREQRPVGVAGAPWGCLRAGR
jgi:hypothetical protein